jgi:hypothetical protein
MRNKKTLRFIMLIVLLAVEASFIVAFYIIPQFHAKKYLPDGHWEMETPLRGSPWVWLILILFLGLFTIGNAILIVLTWRAFKDL